MLACISISDADTPGNSSQASSTTKCILLMSNGSSRPSLFLTLIVELLPGMLVFGFVSDFVLV
jgi:hypothetical protein